MIDLHCHSTRSDGSEAPARVVELAADAGCTALALTDHDTTSGNAEAGLRAAGLGLGFVAGCEISCRFSPGSLHLLCYFADDDGPLGRLLARLRHDRETRNERLVARLRGLGYEVSLERVQAVAGGGEIGRPHFARLLAESGAVATYEEAFDTLLGKGGPAYVPKAFVDPPDAIAAAGGSGALAVLAHPLSLRLEPAALDRVVGELAAAGLTGLECLYGRYSPVEREGLAAIARRHRLVVTGGSDFHGSFKPDLSIGTGTGDLDVPPSALDELRARLP